MSRGFASNYRIVLLAIGLFACFGGLGARLVCLHVIDREQLLRNIVKTRRQTTRETARRGDILDSGGAILATSRPMILVAVDPFTFRPQDEKSLPELAKLLNLPLAEVQQKCLTKYRPASAPAAKSLLPNSEAAKEAKASGAAPAFQVKLNIPAAKPDRGDPDDGITDEVAENMVANNDQSPTPPAVGNDKDDEAEIDGPANTQGLRPYRWVVLSKNVTETTYAEIQKLGIKALCPPERRFARWYPHDELAAHIVGYANGEGKGAAGVEWFSDFYLRGQDGWREGEKDGKRRELAQFQTRDIPRSDGYSVRLTIDQAVQDIVEREIAKIAKTYQPLKATIIVSRPTTGFILGMANYPTFNPNEYNKIPPSEAARMKNVAVADVYEPGSVFKIVAASAALEEGLVNDSSRFNCSNEKVVYNGERVSARGKEYRLREDHHFDHPLSVAEIIARSSNRGAAQLAMLLGETKFEAYARKFGFGSRLGFPFGGEVSGIFYPHEKWVPMDFTRLPMGQAICATALQMHQAMSTIASGGVLLRPQIVKEIRDQSNTVVYSYERSEIDRVISDQTARKMARYLQGVASVGGTAPGAAIVINGVDYEVAGKTATAQKYLPQRMPSGKVKLVPSTKNHVVSFVGFFPASRPQVAISVVIDDADAHCPGGVAYGAALAAPVFKSIGEKLIPILSITLPNKPARVELAAATEGGRR